MFKYPKTLLFVCALISALLITSTSAHYYNLNTGQWQYTSGRQGNYGNRPYTYYPQQPRQQQNPYPNIQIAKADWVCKNAAGDMVKRYFFCIKPRIVTYNCLIKKYLLLLVP